MKYYTYFVGKNVGTETALEVMKKSFGYDKHKN
jgi:hypothetical protein